VAARGSPGGRWVQLTFRMTRPLKRPMRVALTDPERDSIRTQVKPSRVPLPVSKPGGVS
jgi:hypothetical protein